MYTDKWIEPVEESSPENSNQGASPDEGTLDQATVDALLGNASDDAPAFAADSPGGTTRADATSQPISRDDVDALSGTASDTDDAGRKAESGSSSEADAAHAPDTRVDLVGKPFDETPAATQGALDEEKPAGSARALPSENHAGSGAGTFAASAHEAATSRTEPLDLPSFGEAANPEVDPKRLSMLNDVRLRVKIELGRTQMLVEDVLKLGEGSVVELDKLAGDPVDVWVNERLIARGEVLVLNDNFCVRISEVFSNDPHRVSA